MVMCPVWRGRHAQAFVELTSVQSNVERPYVPAEAIVAAEHVFPFVVSVFRCYANLNVKRQAELDESW